MVGWKDEKEEEEEEDISNSAAAKLTTKERHKYTQSSGDGCAAAPPLPGWSVGGMGSRFCLDSKRRLRRRHAATQPASQPANNQSLTL